MLRPLSRPAAYFALFAGLVLVSTSGPFIIMARMDAYAVVLLRTAGAAVVFALAPRALFGDAMCIASGLAITLFYVVARDARRAMPIDAFMALVMAICAAAAAPIVLAARAPVFAYPARSWGWMAGLVLLTTGA